MFAFISFPISFSPRFSQFHSTRGLGPNSALKSVSVCFKVFFGVCCCQVASVVSDCATPWTAAYQASLSLGFSRQEHWSGLPFPSPMHESGKWKWSHSVVSDSLRPHGLQPTRLLHLWDFPGKSTRVGCHCLLHFNWLRNIKGWICFLLDFCIVPSKCNCMWGLHMVSRSHLL